MWDFFNYLYTSIKQTKLAALIGEYECRLDDKCRLMLPTGLKKQLPKKEQKNFVVNRGLEKQLYLWPQKEWDKEALKWSALNQYVKKNRDFIRFNTNGATPSELDSSGRLLLPKSLMYYAGIGKDVILFAHTYRIEIWSKKEYDKYMKQGADDFASLAEEVMGKVPNNEKGNVS